MGHIFAFMTGTRVPADDGSGRDAAETEKSGWIDPKYSRFELLGSRNDVTPLVDCDESDPDLADYVREALRDCSPYEDEEYGTFCGQTEHMNLEDGSMWTYAIHFKRKYYANGWTESSWHPVEDGRITLAP